MGQVDTPRQVTWSVFACCCCCYCCWNIQKSARLLLTPAECRGFAWLSRDWPTLGRPVPYPVFLLYAMFANMWIDFVPFLWANCCFPTCCMRTSCFQIGFLRKLGGEDPIICLSRLAKGYLFVGHGRPEIRTIMLQFHHSSPDMSWSFLFHCLVFAWFTPENPISHECPKNIPWGPAPCAMCPFPRNPRVLWLCPRLGVTTSFGDGHACTTRPAETRIAALWLEAVAVFRSTTSWWWWNQIVHIYICMYVCVCK